MRLEREFNVRAPLDRAWRALSELDVLAACIPGAQLQPSDDIYTGTVVCDATVRSVDRDEDEHVATILLHARQVDGPAIGSATVRSRCEGADGSTKVVLSAEVLMSGCAGGGAATETAGHEVLKKAAAMLEQRAIVAPPTLSAVPTDPAPPPTPAAPVVPVPVAAPNGVQRIAVAGGALVAIVLVRRLLGRRRTGLW
jgi:carbon monoxide dehydrogenase subunit G